MRLLRQFGRCSDQLVEERLVELAVDEAGARTLQLVTHPTGAPDLHVEVVVVRLDGAPDRLAEIEAPLPGRDRIVDDVDREGDHRARPGRWLAAHQRQRHGQPVIDRQPVDDREVEVLLDHRVGDVGRQLGVTDHVGHRAWPPSFVGDRVVGRRADGERRDDVEAERGGVVVVHEDDHVGRVGGEPILGALVPVEERAPVRLVRLVQVDRRADRRDVRRVHARADPGAHDDPGSSTKRLPSGERPPATIMSRYSSSDIPVIDAAICWKLLPSVAPILARK